MHATSRQRGFTLTELLVAIGLTAVLVLVSGMVFRMAVDAHLRAQAAGEITRKLQAITDQLDADFAGLRKDGELVLIWVPSDVRYKDGVLYDPDANGSPNTVDDDNNGVPDRYERMDRLMFFTTGDFQAYAAQPPLPETPQNPHGTTVPVPDKWRASLSPSLVRGNLARVCYMIAKKGVTAAGRPANLPPRRRVLARSRHIFVADEELTHEEVFNPSTALTSYPLDPTNLLRYPLNGPRGYFNRFEYENLTMRQWLDIPLADKVVMLTRLFDVRVSATGLPPTSLEPGDGLFVDGDSLPPLNVHQMFCEGVANFSVQVWITDPPSGWTGPWVPRWYPETDPDHDGDYSDTDFKPAGGLIDTENLPGLYWAPGLYPGQTFETLVGPALKFTFTLYDSKGVFKDGKTFTHIIRLGE